MAESVVTPKASENLFGQVQPGMEVYDRLGQKVGRVDGLQGGADDAQPATVEVVPVMAPVPTQVPVVQPVVKGSKMPEFDTVVDPDDTMPDVVRKRLLHDGFIRIDAGFLRRHRYALREQVERVEGNRVILNVVAADLIKH